MNTQTIRVQGARTPFAIRFFEGAKPEPIRQDGRIVPAPELAGMMHNFELYDGLMVDWFKLSKPERVEGLKATLKAEVWRTRAGTRVRLAETWWATKVPPDSETLAHYIVSFLLAERREQCKRFAKLTPPITAEKRVGEVVDIREASKQSIAKLLRRDYPQFFRAYDQRFAPGVQRKAYIADLTANMGHQPEAAGPLLEDAGFVRWLAAALAKPGWKVSAVEWEIAGGWIPRGYYKMRPDELTRELNRRSGLNLSEEAWRKRIARLQLPNTFTAGRKEDAPPPPP